MRSRRSSERRCWKNAIVNLWTPLQRVGLLMPVMPPEANLTCKNWKNKTTIIDKINHHVAHLASCYQVIITPRFHSYFMKRYLKSYIIWKKLRTIKNNYMYNLYFHERKNMFCKQIYIKMLLLLKCFATILLTCSEIIVPKLSSVTTLLHILLMLTNDKGEQYAWQCLYFIVIYWLPIFPS